MAAPAQSPEQRELALIGKVEMRIALADTDSKLEATLKTYLSPLLLKLISPHPSVRNKVIAVCQHITTRVRPPSIQLPVAALVEQFKAQDSPLIRHFDLLYIQQAVGRLSGGERARLLPTVVKGFAASGSHGAQIFNLLLKLLDAFPLPLRGSKEDVEFRGRLDASDDDMSELAGWLGKLLLYTPQRNPSGASCPGLSQHDVAYLTLHGKDDVWDPSAGGLNLLHTKILAAKLLASGLFTNAQRFLPALFASADPASAVSDVGDDMLKRALPAIDLEDDALMTRLFELYFGQGSDMPRARTHLRLKILGLFTRSAKSTTFAHNIMKMVDDGIAPSEMDGDDVIMSSTSTSNPSIGREATKLRSTIFTYINYVARHGSDDTLSAIALRVVSRLRDFLENQGWPKPGPSEDLVSRGYAYEVIGLLAKAGPRNVLIEDDIPTLDLLRWLFESLAKDTSGNAIIVSIEEALSTVLSAMARLDLQPAEQSALEDLLIDQMECSSDLGGSKRLRSTRYVALRFANRCLPYSSVKARWINVLGLGATKDRAEVKEESERGLSPYWYLMLNGTIGGVEAADVAFPTFGSVMDQFFPGRTTSRGVEPLAVVKQTQALRPSSFKDITSFARRLLFHEAMQKAGIAVKIDGEWERRLDVAIESDGKARDAIRLYLEGEAMNHDQRNLEVLLLGIFETVTGKTVAPDDQLVELLALSPDSLIQKLVPHVDRLIPVLMANHHNRRMTAARAFGILASHPAAVVGRIHELCDGLIETVLKWESAIGSATSQVHGAIVALSFLGSRAAYRSSAMLKLPQFETLIATVLQIIPQSRDDLLKEASFIGLGQMSLFGAISAGSIAETAQLRTIIDKVYEAAKSGNDAAILCLGELSMILPEVEGGHDSDLEYLTEQLHKLHEIRQAEIHFTVGEALSYVASGWRSDALATKLDIAGPKPQGAARNKTLETLIVRVLKDCANTKPALKKAAAIWLLCLVQFCGDRPELQSRLPECQTAFKRCLSDRDELVQETASRGLGLVYEKGDRGLKDDLVRDLVSSFSSDRQSQLAGNVSADTQLFEPGALPTGDGSVSTYKDIMSLASEVGDSSLVYKLMSMASSNAIWSSRAAFGRFGLSNVLSDSSVDGYLANNPKLYPKLFRYRFDPNGGVQRSMNDIWTALVKDSTATIDTHFHAIMEDLLTSILGREWRVRQASCAAIADLVSGRPFDKYDGYLERIWTQCFKVLDDIKESVRAAAASLARTLTGVLTRTLESDHSSTKNASAMLKHVLPFLLSPSGMESSAKDVQMFAVHTLLEIIKKSNGATLRPFIPELVERLIGLLSSLEPEAVNYIHLNASKYNLTEQKIDDMRLSSVRSSPLMEAIERCLDLLDDDTMVQLKPRLESAMKSAVGLPSKVGSGRVLVSLSTRRMALYKPYSDDALKLIEKLVLDRNETVSSSYAVAAGYVARGASDRQILRLITFARQLYFASEGDREGAVPRRAITAGEIMYALSKYASDRFGAVASAALPFVFVAKHDPNDAVREQFQNTWDESVGGSRAVLLYLAEIVQLCTQHLDSAQWTLKHTSARAVADAVAAVASADGAISEAAGRQLWPALDKALGGKTWDGKEVILVAFVKFVETARPFYATRGEVQSMIIKIAIREAKRQNASYRQHSIKAVGQVARALKDSDLFQAIHEIAAPILEDDTDKDSMEIDRGSEASAVAGTLDATRSAAMRSLFWSVNPAVLSGQTLQQAVSEVIMIAAAAMPSSTPSLRRSAYTGIQELFSEIRAKIVDPEPELKIDTPSVARILFDATNDTEALRLLAADAVLAVSQAFTGEMPELLRRKIRHAQQTEQSAAVRERLALVRHGEL